MIYFYTFPAIFLFICYFVVTVREICADVEECRKDHYIPNITVGKS